MSNVTIKIDNHTAEVLAELKAVLPVALGTVGAKAVDYAQQECPVDTGNLKNSIAWATSLDSGGNKGDGEGEPSIPNGTPESNELYIGSNAEYAEYVEFGDASHKVGKKHFLRDSLANHVDHYKAILEAALK